MKTPRHSPPFGRPLEGKRAGSKSFRGGRRTTGRRASLEPFTFFELTVEDAFVWARSSSLAGRPKVTGTVMGRGGVINEWWTRAACVLGYGDARVIVSVVGVEYHCNCPCLVLLPLEVGGFEAFGGPGI